MTTKFRLLILAIAVATLSVRCSNDNSDTPNLPTNIEQHFGSGEFLYEGTTIAYREATVSPTGGKTPLVVVLHGQYASGSDNVSQLRNDAIIRVWHHFSSKNIKAAILVPQCSSRRAWNEITTDNNGVTMPVVLKALIDDYTAKKSIVDPTRIYILGYSDGSQPAGAGGVWRMLSDYPNTFAAGMVVAADPDSYVDAERVAKTPVISIKGESDIHAVALTLDSFGDQVRDAGGVLEEVILNLRSREEVCREAFSETHLNWVLQHNKSAE